MEANELDPGSARTAPPPGHDGAPAEVAQLRSICRRQAALIDTLRRIVATLRCGAQALKAENGELRAAIDRMSLPPHGLNAEPSGEGATIEQRLPLEVGAPHAARKFLSAMLGERLSATALERAHLVISELVTNSVRHSGADPESDVVVRLRRQPDSVWLEVEDSGRAAMAPGNPTTGDGFGLSLVHSLSERWQVERAAAGGTRVSAQLRDAPAARQTGPTQRETNSLGAPANNHATAPRGQAGDLHVVPEPRAGTWRVFGADATTPMCEHTTETGAEAAAQRLAHTTGASRVVIHDRYHRTHLSAARGQG
ncbi:ATP-binding protein, partial [Solirubrobacter ginsenosidimutans]